MMQASDKYEIHNFLLEMIRLLGRMAVFPVPTIALVTGHAFAGGCMFALAHDYRVLYKSIILNNIFLKIMGEGKGQWYCYDILKMEYIKHNLGQ